MCSDVLGELNNKFKSYFQNGDIVVKMEKIYMLLEECGIKSSEVEPNQGLNNHFEDEKYPYYSLISVPVLSYDMDIESRKKAFWKLLQLIY